MSEKRYEIDTLFDCEIERLEDKLSVFSKTSSYDSGCRLAQSEAELKVYLKAKRMLKKWQKKHKGDTL